MHLTAGFQWYNIHAPSVSTMESDRTSCHGYPSPSLHTESQGAEAEDPQHSPTMSPNALLDEPADPQVLPQHDRSPGREWRGSASSESTLFVSSPIGPEEEKVPSYKPTGRDTDDGKASVWDGEEKSRHGTHPKARSTYDSTKTAYFGRKPKNVVLFGETGVGKSSVINLMAGKDIAETSRNLQGCTLESTEYLFGLSEDVSLRIFDTVGLEEPDIGINTFMGALEKAHKLVTSLHSSGGIDLLLFCIRGGRITAAMQRSYRLFFEVLCGSQVPLAIIVTGLEQEEVMEDWWVQNEQAFHLYHIYPTAHACITALPARVSTYTRKREESRVTLQKMLLDTLNNPRSPYVRERRYWFAALATLLRSLLRKGESARRRELVKKLEKRCGLSRADAGQLADILSRGGTEADLA